MKGGGEEGTGRVLGPRSGLGEAEVPEAPEDPSRLRATRFTPAKPSWPSQARATRQKAKVFDGR